MRSLLAGAVLGLVVLVPAVPASSSPVAPTRLWVLDDITVNKPAVPTSGNFGFNLPMYPKEWVLKWSYSTCVTGASGKAWFDMEVVAEGAQPGTPNHDLGYLAQTGSRGTGTRVYHDMGILGVREFTLSINTLCHWLVQVLVPALAPPTHAARSECLALHAKVVYKDVLVTPTLPSVTTEGIFSDECSNMFYIPLIPPSTEPVTTTYSSQLFGPQSGGLGVVRQPPLPDGGSQPTKQSCAQVRTVTISLVNLATHTATDAVWSARGQWVRQAGLCTLDLPRADLPPGPPMEDSGPPNAPSVP